MATRAEIVVKPQFFGVYNAAIRRAQNFFKHSDKDPDPAAALDFDPRETQYVLLDCFDAYLSLTGRSLRELWMFFFWFALEYPDVLHPSPLKDAVYTVVGDGSAPHHDRAAFAAIFDRYVGAAPQLD